jgi:hypothetical protein
MRPWLEEEYGAAEQPLYEGLTAPTIALPAFERVARVWRDLIYQHSVEP